MKTLLTAFKGISNTSCQLVSQLAHETLLLTNSFSGLEKDIHVISKPYDAVYMFGVDKVLNRAIRIEKCARNGDHTIDTEFDIQTLSEQIGGRNIQYHISNTPTRYLCNWAYYNMLCKNKNTVFIHIPSAGGMDKDFMHQLVRLFSDILH